MYVLITQESYSDVMKFIDEAPEYNAHMQAALIRHGFPNSSLKIWALHEKKRIAGVIVILNESAIVYEPQSSNFRHLLDFFSWNHVRAITGPRYLTDVIRAYVEEKKYDVTTIARLDSLQSIRQIKEERLREINSNLPYLEGYNLLNIKEKIILQNHVFDMDVDIYHEGIYQLLEAKALNGYMIRVQGRVVAVGEWLNQHPVFGLIVGIATHEEYRNRHFALGISISLCEEIVHMGKIPLLRYSNPIAGQLYHKMGFVDIGDFGTLYM